MTEKDQKPNYDLHYGLVGADDFIKKRHLFYALNDDVARATAQSFIEQHNAREEAEVMSGKKSYRTCVYEGLGLERIAYVMKETEERTSIPLEGRCASLERNHVVESDSTFIG